MNSVLRYLGIAGVVLVALLLVRDALRDQAPLPAPELPQIDHEGFPLPLEGLGTPTLTLIGESGWTLFDEIEGEDGTVNRVARWRVDGVDPAPDGDGVAIRDAVLRSLDPDSPLLVRSPLLWIPTEPGGAGPQPDRTRRWQLTAPVIEVADLFDGRAAVIRSESAELDAENNRMFGHGPFELLSGSLRLTGSELRYAPSTQRVDFSPHEGAVRWWLDRGDEGGTVRGDSDGDGFLAPAGEGRAQVRFEAARQVRTFLPTEGGGSGELRTRDLDLLLASGSSGEWQPIRAYAAGPTRWQDPGRLLAGGDSTLEFDGSGDPSSLDLEGPVRLFPGEGALDWATAVGGAWFDPSREAVYLHGGFTAQRGGNAVRGGWARLEGGRIRAGGGIWAWGEDGLARADTLREVGEGEWLAEGNAVFHPASPTLDEVGAPRILMLENGDFETDTGFRALAMQDGVPVTMTGLALRSRVRGDERRTHADGGLVVEKAGMRLTAERMRQVGPEQLQLFGAPVRGEATLDEGAATLRAGRADWSSGELTLRRAPRLQAPAAALGLVGEQVTVDAAEMARAVDGAWHLSGQVALSGDLRGSGDEARWSPDGRFELASWSDVAALEGARLDGTVFAGEATRMVLEPDGRFELDGRAWVRLQRAEDAVASELRGEHVEGDLDAAFAEGFANFTTAEGSGAAFRIELERVGAGERDYDLHLIGDARLEQDGMIATGRRIDYAAASGDVEVLGAVDRRAVILLADGRRASGTRLRYNPALRLFSGDDLRIERP